MSSRTPRRRGQPIKQEVESPALKKDGIASQANDSVPPDENEVSPNQGIKRKLNDNYYCEVCEKSCCGPFVFAEHIRSQKHTKKLKAVGSENAELSDAYQNMVNEISSLPVVENSQFLKCEVCNITVTGMNAYQQHTSGIKHYRNLQKQEILNQVQENNMDKYTGKLSAEQNSDYCCKVCDKTFSGPLPYRDHLQGKKHKARIGVIDAIKEKTDDNKPGEEEFLAQQSAIIGEGEVTSKVFEKSSPECKLCNKKFSGIVPYVGHIKSKSHVKKKLLANLAAAKTEGTGDHTLDANNDHMATDA